MNDGRTARPASAKRGSPDPAELDAAIADLVGYTVRACDERGRFLYRLDLDRGRAAGDIYNIVRHAGAVYALARYALHHPRGEVIDAMVRSARFLVDETVRPVRAGLSMLAVWSDPSLERVGDRPVATLGGAGLGLAALSLAQRSVPDVVDPGVTKALADFIRYLQNPSGSFCMRFDSRSRLPDRRVPVLFFPGEAILGLALHHGNGPDPAIRRCALRGLDNLVRAARSDGTVAADHWILLATDAWLPWLRGHEGQKELIDHCAAMARRMVSRRPRFAPGSPLHGCLNVLGRTCGTSTSLEGLQAARAIVAADDPALVRDLDEVVVAGLGFLLRTREAGGPWAGAMPCAVRSVELPRPRVPLPASVVGRTSEVRIDYVQHALCAMMQARFGPLAGLSTATAQPL